MVPSAQFVGRQWGKGRSRRSHTICPQVVWLGRWNNSDGLSLFLVERYHNQAKSVQDRKSLQKTAKSASCARLGAKGCVL